MSEVLEEFEKYVANNKEVLNVLPLSTKPNKTKYLAKVNEMLEEAQRRDQLVFDEIQKRYKKITTTHPNKEIMQIEKDIEDLGDINLYNELNTAFEKLSIDKMAHDLGCFFEADLQLVNENIKSFIETFKTWGIVLSEKDFNYSAPANEYMKVFFEEYAKGDINSEKIKKTFENLYWKCPEIVTHIELNIRYLYYINSKKLEKDLEDRNNRIFASGNTNKNNIVKKYFELNKELLQLKRKDDTSLLNHFLNEEWKIKDFNDKEMSVLYDRLYTKNYYELSEERRIEVDENFCKLLNTLSEYNIYTRYKYIIDDIKERYSRKDSFKGSYEAKNKELRKKEQELLKETQKNGKLITQSKNPIINFFRRKMEKKRLEVPASINSKIKELKQLYAELDEAIINEKIAEFVDDDCTIKYMFKIAISYYSYAYDLIKEHYKGDTDINIGEELQDLIDFINQPYKVMLNNIKLVEEPDIREIVSNRYKILNISLEKESLEEESIEEVTRDVEKIVNFYAIRNSNLKIEDIEFYEKAKLIISKRVGTDAKA